jgi:hypothetical protein
MDGLRSHDPLAPFYAGIVDTPRLDRHVSLLVSLFQVDAGPVFHARVLLKNKNRKYIFWDGVLIFKTSKIGVFWIKTHLHM